MKENIQLHNDINTNFDPNILWTDKYSPKKIEDIIDNKSKIKELKEWLTSWKNGNKDNIRNAVLISGNPGIGKTTSALLVAKNLGYDIIIKNASDTRNKKAVENFLDKSTFNQVLSFDKKNNFITKPQCIIMDEIDGMFSDRGGTNALLKYLKITKVPIICICNDNLHQKIKSILYYCQDIKFKKPNKNTLHKYILDICNKENIQIDSNSLDLIIEMSNGDIRQILNYIQKESINKYIAFNNLSSDNNNNFKDKNINLNLFTATETLFNNKLNILEKKKIFFIDYGLIPIMIQENYIKANNNISIRELKKKSLSIAYSNIIETKMKKKMNFEYLVPFSFFSTIYPTKDKGYINRVFFASKLGKNSSKRKINKEIKELKIELGQNIPFFTNNVIKEYISPYLINMILNIFKNNNLNDNNENIINLFKNYNLSPDLLKNHLSDIMFNTKKVKFYDSLSKADKTKMTKIYNEFVMKKTKIKENKKQKNIIEEIISEEEINDFID